MTIRALHGQRQKRNVRVLVLEFVPFLKKAEANLNMISNVLKSSPAHKGFRQSKDCLPKEI